MMRFVQYRVVLGFVDMSIFHCSPGFHMPPSRHSCDELMSRSLYDACGEDEDSDYMLVEDFCDSRVSVANGRGSA